ncbi:class I SAM-dependent methyltransferase [Candidatus Izemoplasma sp. B36]|uniref:class I SAM-dependent methyltransferase n=1 Tax=Candidatus Izemoplasma sp. B36 TaxID=3242468 RepID=UPI00355794BE
MEKLKQFLEENKDARILDVGTGRGNFIAILDHLNKDYQEIIGIDIFEPAISVASKFFEKNKKVKILNADINNNNFKDEAFDIVCLSNSLHHLEDISLTFKSMERLVKPGGYLLFNEMMKDNLNDKQISHKLLHHFSAKLDRESGMFHGETYNRNEIVDLIKKESSFLVKDFWNMATPQEAEATDEQIKNFAKTVDVLLGRLNPDLQKKYKEEAGNIKKYILYNGVEGCTQLLLVAKNNKN